MLHTRLKKLILVIISTVGAYTLYLVAETTNWTQFSAPRPVEQITCNYTTHGVNLQNASTDPEEIIGVVVLVISHARDADRRMAIRHTWGGAIAARVDSRVIFSVFGADVENEERDRFGDVYVTGSQSSSVTPELLAWLVGKFPNIDILVKVADETFINPTALQAKINRAGVGNFKCFGQKSTTIFTFSAIDELRSVADNHEALSCYYDKISADIHLDPDVDVEHVPKLCDVVFKNKTVSYTGVASIFVMHTLWWVLNDERFNSCSTSWRDWTFLNNFLH